MLEGDHGRRGHLEVCGRGGVRGGEVSRKKRERDKEYTSSVVQERNRGQMLDVSQLFTAASICFSNVCRWLSALGASSVDVWVERDADEQSRRGTKREGRVFKYQRNQQYAPDSGLCSSWLTGGK